MSETSSKANIRNSSTVTNPTYSTLSKRMKTMIVTIVFITCFTNPLSANMYFPALNVIGQELQLLEQQVHWSITVYMMAQGVSPCLWGSIADTYGRRPVLIITILIYFSACVGLACTQNYITLLFLRILQAFGASSSLALGTGAIGDISTPDERGGYMGILSMGSMMGTLVGPVLGGIITYQLGWRWIMWVLAIFAGIVFIMQICLFPETLRSLVGDGSGYANPTPLQYWRQQSLNEEKDETNISTQHSETNKLHLLKPLLQPFLNLKEKDIIILLVYNSLQYASLYCVMTSSTKLYSEIYGLQEIQIGLCYLSNGFGALLGSYTCGKLLNWRFRKIARSLKIDEKYTKRGSLDPDFPIERARLGVTWIWGLLFNIFMICYGWCLFYKLHIAIPISINFILSYCATSTFNAVSTLLVDLFPINSAACIASNNLVRCLLAALATLTVQPGLKILSPGWYFTTVSSVLFVSRITMFFELKFGPKWRAKRLEKQSEDSSP
ncbi:major facilitator superfamily domain-containing protein [Mycotypha africana]|uniref:major facilitator superfamily domain-containing protein n=1 Tax=Mycotypha africana TaxID=64632 RepID=UPI002301D6E8|nr:major facilitator superfamily domain-containing protein [Mycotypha africana]KAI8970430.1 major facilitator superfamily domain-containing protein [Mycotypha africana]